MNNTTTKPMATKTAMQQLLNQMKEERSKLPMPIEWDRAYQAIEMMIEHTYMPMEKEQIIEANADGQYLNSVSLTKRMCLDGAECYYNEQYGSEL